MNGLIADVATCRPGSPRLSATYNRKAPDQAPTFAVHQYQDMLARNRVDAHPVKMPGAGQVIFIQVPVNDRPFLPVNCFQDHLARLPIEFDRYVDGRARLRVEQVHNPGPVGHLNFNPLILLKRRQRPVLGMVRPVIIFLGRGSTNQASDRIRATDSTRLSTRNFPDGSRWTSW